MNRTNHHAKGSVLKNALLLGAILSATFVAGSRLMANHPPDASARQLVHLKSSVAKNDGAGGHFLFVDGDETRPLVVPTDERFVITDLLIEPVFSPASSDALYMVSIDLTRGGARRFNARFVGSGTEHLDFAGGLTVPGGQSPTLRNLAASASPVEFTVIGYFAD